MNGFAEGACSALTYLQLDHGDFGRFCDKGVCAFGGGLVLEVWLKGLLISHVLGQDHGDFWGVVGT